MRQVEHHRQVQRIRADCEGFLQDPVGADPGQVDAAADEMHLQILLGNRSGGQRSPGGDQDVGVRGVRPDGPAVLEPGF